MQKEGNPLEESAAFMGTERILLSVEDLSVKFYLSSGTISAVNHLSFSVRKGTNFGIVGESGSGKSVTALTIMRLVAIPPAKVDSGRIVFDGEDLLKKSPDEMRSVRGKRIAMIYQDPMTSLNPVLRVGFQIAESVMVHEKVPRKEAYEKAIQLMHAVGIPEPEKRARAFPHQFSGGMRQRIMIAMALSTDPEILIADEPTTALDVITQAQILSLMKSLQRQRNMTVILITHDLGIVAEFCEEVLVMYAGAGMEHGTTSEIFSNPKHPYTKGLLQSITRVDRDISRLKSIPGEIPNLMSPPGGCRFHPRCTFVFPKCMTDEPKEFVLSGGRFSKCWLSEGESG
ncbi:MAG TPA: ABC transporter ATP-binding protein [Nitrososphaerales archaeon]|nr:ABC transporter ATP-binding protein [Nitrososphaerales archaeon]